MLGRIEVHSAPMIADVAQIPTYLRWGGAGEEEQCQGSVSVQRQ
jgi:hypothetical protein